MTEVVVTVNSPGEVATWLEPLARELLPRLADGRLTVMIPPCTYASGAEARVVRSFLGGDPRVAVLEPQEVLGWLLLGRRPRGYEPVGRGAVLFLGGDMVYAAWIARRLGYRALAYTEGRVRWTGTFERFLLPDERALERALRRLGAQAEGLRPRLEVVGDLMVDAARSRIPLPQVRAWLGLEPGEQLLLLLPGSRAAEIHLVLPSTWKLWPAWPGLRGPIRRAASRGGRSRAVVALSPSWTGRRPWRWPGGPSGRRAAGGRWGLRGPQPIFRGSGGWCWPSGWRGAGRSGWSWSKGPAGS